MAAAKPTMVRSTGIVSLMTIFSRILGMLRDSVTAYLFGAGWMTDAFFVAFRIPNLLRSLVAEGSFQPAFVPVFTEELNLSEDAAKRALGAVTSFMLIWTTVLVLIGMYYCEELTALFAPGFGVGTESAALATNLTLIMFPYIIMVSTWAIFGSVLNCLGRYALPASAQTIFNAVMIISVFLLYRFFEMPIYALAIAVLIGGAASAYAHLWELKQLGFSPHLRSPIGEPAVRKLRKIMLPAVVSASIYQLTVFLNTLLASLFGEGSVSYIYYADRLFQFPLGVFTMALATTSLPTFSRLLAVGDQRGFEKQLAHSLNWISFVTIPAATGLIVLSTDIVRVFFEHGTFGPEATRETALVLCAFSFGLWPMSIQSILVRGFFAKKLAKLPAVVSCITIFINFALALAFMGTPPFEATTTLAQWIYSIQNKIQILSMGVIGLPMAIAASSCFAVLALILMLRRAQTDLDLHSIIVCFIKSLACSALMGLALKYLLAQGFSSYLVLTLGIPFGCIAFVASALVVRPEPMKQVVTFALRRFARG